MPLREVPYHGTSLVCVEVTLCNEETHLDGVFWFTHVFHRQRAGFTLTVTQLRAHRHVNLDEQLCSGMRLCARQQNRLRGCGFMWFLPCGSNGLPSWATGEDDFCSNELSGGGFFGSRSQLAVSRCVTENSGLEHALGSRPCVSPSLRLAEFSLWPCSQE